MYVILLFCCMGMGKRFLLKNDDQFLITQHFVGIDLFPHMNVINAIEVAIVKVVRVSPNHDVIHKEKLLDSFAYCAFSAMPSALSHSSSNFDFWYPTVYQSWGRCKEIEQSAERPIIVSTD